MAAGELPHVFIHSGCCHHLGSLNTNGILPSLMKDMWGVLKCFRSLLEGGGLMAGWAPFLWS